MGYYRILLADDHALIRQGLAKIIEGTADLKVVGEAGDGLELLSRIDYLSPHMIILDLSMPKLSGIEAIPQLRSRYPELKILVLTMHEEYLHRALAAGADGYLVKEDADRELFSAITNLRQGKVYISPRLAERFSGGRAALPEPLSNREKEVLKLIATGKSNKKIAEILFLSVRTVESHRASILKKLQLKSAASLVKYAIEKGYV